MSRLSSFNALSFVRFLFNGIASAKCIVVPLMLNVTFHVYVNFMTFGFEGSTFGVTTHYGDPLHVITLHCFSRLPFLNLNHVKTTKYFHNVFVYYGKAQPKTIIEKNHFFFIL